MFWEIVPVLTIALFLFAIIGFAYVITAKIYGHKSAAKAIAQYVVVLGILAGGSYLVTLWLSPAQINTVLISIYAVFSLLFIFLFVAHVSGKRQVETERVLLEIGLGDTGFWLIILGILFLGSSISSISNMIVKSLYSVNEILHIVFKFLVGTLAVYKGFGKTILTENGIFSLFGYAKWKKIKSYKWDDGKFPVLKLKIADPLLSLLWISVIIPNTQRAAVENFLAQELLKPEDS